MKKFSFFRRTWFWVFISGLALFLATDWALSTTSNPNYLPTVILLGAFLVPVTFIAYTYQRVPARETMLPAIAITFLWGGALGLVVAGVLEYETARKIGVVPMVGVGLIEETAKLVLPIIIFVRGRYRSEADGLLFGITAGMGFAALETMGYSFVALLRSQGDVSILHQTLFVRGLLSPAGHAAWTGLVCAVLWRERERAGHAVFKWAIVGAFLLVVFLHSSWDVSASLSEIMGPGWVVLDFIGLVAIAGISFWLLIRRMRESKRIQPSSTAEVVQPARA